MCVVLLYRCWICWGGGEGERTAGREPGRRCTHLLHVLVVIGCLCVILADKSRYNKGKKRWRKRKRKKKKRRRRGEC